VEGGVVDRAEGAIVVVLLTVQSNPGLFVSIAYGTML
jgi:hypothetical protein